MINVLFYSFSKRANSTARPDNPNLELACILKGTCSIINPVLIVKHPKPTDNNYCYIPDFGRYYHIDDWTWNSGVWSANCSVDVLASWKTEIGNSQQYVTRAAAERNGYVMDAQYPITANISTVRNYAENPWTGWEDGSYIVGVLGQGVVATGSVSYMVFSAGELANFVSRLLNSGNLIGNMIDGNPDFEISEELATIILDPIKYISTCMWVPFTDISGGGAGAVTIGWWTVPGTSGKYLYNWLKHTDVADIAIPKHPQAARGEYLNHAPFSRYYLEFEPFGKIELPDRFLTGESLRLHVYTDLTTGTAFLQCNGEIIASGQVGITTPITSMQSGVLRNVGNIATSVAGIVAGNPASVFGMAGSLVDTFTGLASPDPTTAGAVQGSRISYAVPPTIVATFADVASADPEHFGNPVCARLQISTLNGFVKCENAELDIPATAQERSEIDNYLNGGFFYE